MTPLQIASVVVAMVLSTGTVIFVAGKVVQRLASHEELDTARFNALQKMWEETRDDTREIRNAVMGRRV